MTVLDKEIICLSVVSHKQGDLITMLFSDIQKYCSDTVEVILTLNVDETLPFNCDDFSFPIKIIRNQKPKGYGANHNASFKVNRHSFFCVMNPDVRLKENPFPALLEFCRSSKIGIVAPLILNPQGFIENSARRFPTPVRIATRLFSLDTRSDYRIDNKLIFADWVAGMFMLFPADTYRKIGGFDEGYFLYYEDVDICARLWMAGFKVVLCPEVSLIHDARYQSHRSLKYLKWHISGMARFFYSRLTGRYNASRVSQ